MVFLEELHEEVCLPALIQSRQQRGQSTHTSLSLSLSKEREGEVEVARWGSRRGGEEGGGGEGGGGEGGGEERGVQSPALPLSGVVGVVQEVDGVGIARGEEFLEEDLRLHGPDSPPLPRVVHTNGVH